MNDIVIEFREDLLRSNYINHFILMLF